jgi:hypothetical protein
MLRYQKENNQIREQLEADIKKCLASGGKIDVRQPGESVAVDATDEWPNGFSNDDNITFGKKGSW